MATTQVAAMSVDERNAAVEDGFVAALEADGFSKDENGEKKPDKPKLAGKIREALLKSAIARNLNEREARAAAIGALTALVFGSTPAPGSSAWENDPNGVNQGVWALLFDLVDKATEASRRGAVQKLVAKDNLVVVKAKVGLDKTRSVYLTDDPTLLLMDYVGPRSARLQSVAEGVASDLGIVAVRVPGMKKAITTRLDTGLKDAAVNAKAVLAQITATSSAPDDDGDSAK